MSLETLQSFSLLKSSRFIFQLLTIPKFIENGINDVLAPREIGSLGTSVLGDYSLKNITKPELLSNMPVLCESIEFPGQTITGSDFRMPGRLKIKVPTIREINEVQATFLYPIEVPMYELFSSWITNISTVSSKTQYYNNIVGEARIQQYGEDSAVSSNSWGAPILIVNLKQLYPTQVNSLQSNWSDDGFHRMNVSFFFENFEIETPSVVKFAEQPNNQFEADAIKALRGQSRTIQFGGAEVPYPSVSSQADRYNFATNLNFKFP